MDTKDKISFNPPPTKTNWFHKSINDKYLLIPAVVILLLVGFALYRITFNPCQGGIAPAAFKNSVTGEIKSFGNCGNPAPAGWVLLNPIKDENSTINWKTYTNSQYGFELKYPGNLYLKNPQDIKFQKLGPNDIVDLESTQKEFYTSTGFLADGAEPGVNIDTNGYRIIVSVYPNPKKLTLNEWSKQIFGDEDVITTDIPDIAGQKALFYATQEAGAYSGVWFGYQDKIFGLTYESDCVDCNNANVDQEAEGVFNQILSTFKFTDSSTTTYKLIDLSGDFGTPSYYDSKLVKISPNGQEIILVPSIKEVIPDLAVEPNRTLQELSLPKNSSRLYFVEIISDTDLPPRALYVYDLNTNKFSKMSVSQYYAGFGDQVLSPDGLEIASTIGPNNETVQKLFLVDLNSDTAKVIVNLKGNETLNLCVSNCFGGYQAIISWKDSNTIEYSVYNSSKIIGADINYQSHPLIENRTVKIN